MPMINAERRLKRQMFRCDPASSPEAGRAIALSCPQLSTKPKLSFNNFCSNVECLDATPLSSPLKDFDPALFPQTKGASQLRRNHSADERWPTKTKRFHG